MKIGDTGGQRFNLNDKVSYVVPCKGSLSIYTKVGTIRYWDRDWPDYVEGYPYYVVLKDGTWEWVEQDRLTLVEKAPEKKIINK